MASLSLGAEAPRRQRSQTQRVDEGVCASTSCDAAEASASKSAGAAAIGHENAETETVTRTGLRARVATASGAACSANCATSWRSGAWSPALRMQGAPEGFPSS